MTFDSCFDDLSADLIDISSFSSVSECVDFNENSGKTISE
jgi:hypothetical protein